MKKVLFSVAIVALFAATSCKKDYTCECKYTVGGSPTSYVFEIPDVNESEAESKCDYNVEGVSDVSCELK